MVMQNVAGLAFQPFHPRIEMGFQGIGDGFVAFAIGSREDISLEILGR
jgi:hypothetical protein